MRTSPFGKALYVKAFLLGWPIASAIALIPGLLMGYPFGSAFTTAAALGAALSAVLTVALVNRFGPLQGDAPVRPTTRLVLSMPYDAAFDLCTQAVRSIPSSTLDESTRDAGRISARLPRSPESWGERVVVTVRANGPETEITVSSRPTMPLTLGDQGKNRRNVEQIVDALRA